MSPKQIIYPLKYGPSIFSKSIEHEEEKFVRDFSQLVGSRVACLPLGRARTGIYLLIRQFISGGRNKVVMSPFTIPDLVNMVKFAGGVPVFVDHEPKSTHVCLDSLSGLLDKSVACVLVTHYHVNQRAMKEIRALCDQTGAELIEDCAISLGGETQVGSVGLSSRAGVFSLSSYKFLNYFWGGVVVSGDEALMSRLKEEVGAWGRLRLMDYRSQFIRTLKYDFATRPLIFNQITSRILKSKASSTKGVSLLQAPRIESDEFDASLSSRPGLTAFAEWNRKLHKVTCQLKSRRKIAALYDELLGDNMISSDSDIQVKEGSCYVNYPVWVGAEHRDVIYRKMIQNGFDIGLNLYPNVHTHPTFQQIEGITKEVTSLCESTISLPTHPRITPEYASRLAGCLKSLLRGRD